MKRQNTKSLITGVIILIVLFPFSLNAQKQNKSIKPTNIILIIGDGMGVTQLYSGLTMNHGTLNLLKFKSVGFSKTNASNDYTTDSGAGGTAIATGHKTYNGAIGVNKDTLPVKSILELAESNGLSTGIAATSSLTDATPASFVAHVKSRYLMEEIAYSYLNSGIDVMIGGGLNYFVKRKDKQYLPAELRKLGYQVVFSADSIGKVTNSKLACFTAPDNNLTMAEGRGDMLARAVQTSLEVLQTNKKGFFLMVEGSLIDKVAHTGQGNMVAQEVIDLDNAIGKALDFAMKNGNTLIIVTADHETGGMSLSGGDYTAGTIDAKFAGMNHTGVMVPVFAYGPGAENFQGIQENTDLFYKMISLFGFETDH